MEGCNGGRGPSEGLALGTLGFEPVGRGRGRSLWFPTPMQDLPERSEVVSERQGPNTVHTYLPIE